MKKSLTEIEHYIPEIYLSQFAIPGYQEPCLWAFNLGKMQAIPKPVTVYSQCQIKYLYELHNESGEIIDPNKFENLFIGLEGEFASIIKQIKDKTQNETTFSEIMSGYTALISPSQAEIIKLYVLSQILRFPETIRYAEDEIENSVYVKDSIHNRKNLALNICLSFLNCIYSGDDTDPINWKDFSDRIDHNNVANLFYQNQIKNKDLVFVKSDYDCFLTSDMPFYFYKGKAIVFPLTPNLGLILKEKKNTATQIAIYNNDMKLINYIQETTIVNANKFIYSNHEFSKTDISLISKIHG